MEQKAWIRKQSGMTTAGQTESCCMERGLEKSEIEIREKNGVTYLAFPALDATGLVSHAFSTRHGGVSEGVFSTMNFSFTRNDDPQHVMENYRRMAAVLGTDAEKIRCFRTGCRRVCCYKRNHQRDNDRYGWQLHAGWGKKGRYYPNILYRVRHTGNPLYRTSLIVRTS